MIRTLIQLELRRIVKLTQINNNKLRLRLSNHSRINKHNKLSNNSLNRIKILKAEVIKLRISLLTLISSKITMAVLDKISNKLIIMLKK